MSDGLVYIPGPCHHSQPEMATTSDPPPFPAAMFFITHVPDVPAFLPIPSSSDQIDLKDA